MSNNQEGTTTPMSTIPTFVLPATVRRFIEQSQESVWTTDHEYYEALVAVETSRVMAAGFGKTTAGAVFSVRSHESMFGEPDAAPILRGKSLGQKLQNLVATLEKKCLCKLSRMTRKPILEVFLDRLNVSKLEQKIFRYFLVRSTELVGETSDPDDMGYGLPGGVPSLSLMDTRELFADSNNASLASLMPLLVGADSVWVKEQLYQRSSSPHERISAMDEGALLILMGLEISVAQYRAIGSSILQNTIIEDEAFQKTATGKAILEEKKNNMARAGASTVPAQPSVFTQALKESDSKVSGKKRERIFDVLSRVAEDGRKKQVTENGVADKKPVEKDMEEATRDSKKPKVKGEEDEERGTNVQKPCEEKDGQESAKQVAHDEFGPYASDLEYLEDQILLMKREVMLAHLKKGLEDITDDDDREFDIEAQISMRRVIRRHGMNPNRPGQADSIKHKQQQKATRLEQSVKLLCEKIRNKISASLRENGKEFRLEQLCEALKLETFEKRCLLEMVMSVVMPGLAVPTPSGSRTTAGATRSKNVGFLINKFCFNLEERMQSRRFFYKSSTLIQEGMLTLSQQDFMTDLSNCTVELDRRLFDYIVGLDTEMSEIVDGSHLYLPDVNFDDVVVPKETKHRILDTVLNFDKVKDTYYRYEIDKKITYGLGQVMLFYGASGTGKTMLANAVATKIKRKILLVNFPNLGCNCSGAILKFLFREARINRAILFFDECESLFKDRNKGGTSVNMILTELERFDGLCILATNRAYDLDEAMHRRISLAIEFRKPDHIMREEIWKTLRPPLVPIEDDINFGLLARKYELTGGLIKNSWLQSVGLMVQRGGDKIREADLTQAAGEQVVGQLSLEEFDRRVVPTCGLESMVLPRALVQSLNNIVQNTKAQSVLFGQWGFEKIHRSTTGISALFTGAPGTGKSMAAEAIGFDLGRPLLVVNVSELVSKWVGETGKNIEAVFTDAKKKDAVLVFDEAEGLFGSRSAEAASSTGRHDTMNVGLLLQYIENCSGVCIVITNMKSAIDEAFFRRFRFVLDFEEPDATAREKIWKSMVPKDCPCASNVSFRELASRYVLCGGDIKNALLCAATSAALRPDEKDRKVTMDDLKSACEAEVKKVGDNKGVMAMYS